MLNLQHFLIPKNTPLMGRFSLTAIMRLFGLCLMTAGWLVPNKTPPWTSFLNEAVACTGFVLLLASFWSVRSFRLSGSILFFLMVIFASSLSQLFTGKNLFASDIYLLWVWLGLIAMGISVGVTCAQAADQGNKLSVALAQMVLIGAFFSATLALVQWSGGAAAWWINEGALGAQPYGNLGQPNHLATLLVMGLAGLLYLYEAGRLSPSVMLILGPYFLFCVAMSESRTGALSVLALGGWWALKSRRMGFKLPVAAVIFGLIYFVFLVYFWIDICALFATSSARAETRLSAGTRPIMWAQMLAAIAKHPWVGNGWLQTSAAQNSVADLFLSGENTLYAHNLLIDLMVWAGVPVGLLLGSMVLVWAWRHAYSAQGLTQWFGLAALVPLGIHSMLEYPYAYMYFVLPASLLVGLLEGGQVMHRTVTLSRRWWFFALACISTYLSAQFVEYLRIEEDFRVVRFEAANYGATPTDYDAPNVYVNTQLGTMLQAARLKIRPAMSTKEIDNLRRSALRFPWSEILFRYVVAQALNGNIEEAKRQLDVLRTLHGEKQYSGAKARLVLLRDSEYPQLAVLIRLDGN